MSARQLTEWLLLEEDETCGDERADLHTALMVEAFSGTPRDDTLRFIKEYVTSIIDADEFVERKAAAKSVRVKKAKAKMNANLSAAKAVNNGKQHRTVERPGKP